MIQTGMDTSWVDREGVRRSRMDWRRGEFDQDMLCEIFRVSKYKGNKGFEFETENKSRVM